MSIVFTVTGSAKSNNNDIQYSEISNILINKGLVKSKSCKLSNLISINHNGHAYKEFIRLGGNYRKSVLIRLEPYSVYPAQYSLRIEKKYGLIISPGKTIQQKDLFDFIGWPYKYHLNPSRPLFNEPEILNLLPEILNSNIFEVENWVKRNNRIVMIAANKVSPTSKSNYGLRRKIASAPSNDKLDVFGPMWGESIIKKISYRLAVGFYSLRTGFLPNLNELYGNLFQSYPTYKGEIIDKHLVLKEYRFSLIIENDNNYISEKLFDSILSGTIPIYIGPKCSEINLPANLYIWSDGSLEDLNSITEYISIEKVTKMLTDMKNFLNSEDFKKYWVSKSVYELISERILDFWKT